MMIKRITIIVPLAILTLIILAGIIGNQREQPTELKQKITNLAVKSGKSSSKCQNSLSQLDKIVDLDTIPKINDALKIVENLQLLFYQANQDSDDLSDFIIQNKDQLHKEGLDVFLDMEGLINETYFAQRKALREFLNTYKVMLEYSRDNFESIRNGNEPQHSTYNELFANYKNALDVHNESYLKHMKYVNEYSREHPDLAEVITKARKDLRNE